MATDATVRTGTGSDSDFAGLTYRGRIDALLRSSANPEGRLIQMADLAREVVQAGLEELERSNRLQREIESAQARLVQWETGTTPVRPSSLLDRLAQAGTVTFQADEPDPELEAMAAVSRALEPLTPDERKRVLGWAFARFEEAL